MPGSLRTSMDAATAANPKPTGRRVLFSIEVERKGAMIVTAIAANRQGPSRKSHAGGWRCACPLERQNKGAARVM